MVKKEKTISTETKHVNYRKLIKKINHKIYML
jgi:hypothetical protein